MLQHQQYSLNRADVAGLPEPRSVRAANTFFIHDEQTLKRLSAIRNEDEYVSAARESIEELERVIQADRQATNLHIDEGWDEIGLITEATANPKTAQ